MHPSVNQVLVVFSPAGTHHQSALRYLIRKWKLMNLRANRKISNKMQFLSVKTQILDAHWRDFSVFLMWWNLWKAGRLTNRTQSSTRQGEGLTICDNIGISGSLVSGVECAAYSVYIINLHGVPVSHQTMALHPIIALHKQACDPNHAPHASHTANVRM